MMTAEIRLLGSPTLIKAGRRARLHSAKTLALLAYLTLETDTAHSREKLSGLLWGDRPESRARQSLRQALYSLRRALGDDVFVLQGSAVTFAPRPGLWVDALEFQTLAAAPAESSGLDAWRKAADLYRGMLLEGLELSDCDAFDEWLFFQRDGLEQQALNVLQNLVDGLLDQGDDQHALAYAGRLVTLDPLHEGAHRRLMRIYGALDDRDGVRRQYRLCADVLQRELGAEPAGETQALYRQLTALQAAPTTSGEQAPPPQLGEHPLTLPFMGRERELAVLGDHFDQAIRGQGQLVLVSGEAGVGKTRLVEEFLRHRVERAEPPVRYLAGRCYEPESRAPYTMWGDALQGISGPDWQPCWGDLADVWYRQVARLVPTLGSPADDIEGATLAEGRLRLMQGIVQALAHLTQAGALILWFDDLHWADEASLELLHYVARHTTAHPLFIIGVYRPDAAVDNPHLDPIKGSHRVTAVELASLAKKTVDQMLLRVKIEGQADLANRLYRHSDGNPLFLIETLNTLAESGKLLKPDGSAAEEQTEFWPVPQRIQDLIQARIACLGEKQRRILAAGAIIGRPFGLRLVRRISGFPELETLDAVEQILKRGFLDEQPGNLPHPALTFRHGYFRRVIYAGLSAVQRRALHRRAARALLDLHQARPQTVTEEIAHHFEQAGDLQAVSYLAQSAQQARELYAYQHATELYSRALSFLGQHQPDDLKGRFDLLLGREVILDRQGRRSEQADDVAELKRLAKSLGDTDRLAMSSVREAGLQNYTGQYDDARRAGERALALYRAADDKAGEVQALRELGFLSWSAGDYGTALACGRAALQLHRRLGDVEGEATALHNLAEIHRSLGSPRQAMMQYQTALELYWARQDRRRQGLTLYGMAHALRQLGEHDQAWGRYLRALENCQAAGDRLMTSRVHHTLASLHWEAGKADQALDHIQQALDISQEIGYGPGVAHGLVVLGELQAQRGNRNIAREHFQEALTWLRLTEDQAGLAEAERRLHALETGTLAPSAHIGWIKGHIALAEGKVYCEFESPMARAKN